MNTSLPRRVKSLILPGAIFLVILLILLTIGMGFYSPRINARVVTLHGNNFRFLLSLKQKQVQNSFDSEKAAPGESYLEIREYDSEGRRKVDEPAEAEIEKLSESTIQEIRDNGSAGQLFCSSSHFGYMVYTETHQKDQPVRFQGRLTNLAPILGNLRALRNDSYALILAPAAAEKLAAADQTIYEPWTINPNYRLLYNIETMEFWLNSTYEDQKEIETAIKKSDASSLIPFWNTTFAALPLKMDPGTVGAYLIIRQNPGIDGSASRLHFHLMLLVTLLGLLSMAAALLLIRYSLKISNLQGRDKTTGLYSQKLFTEILDRTLTVSKRYDKDLSLICIQLNNYGKLKTHYGKFTADEVLREVVQRVQNRIRNADSFARWGSDFMLILLPETPLTGAARVAEMLSSELEKGHYPHQIPVSTSLGILEVHPEETTDEWVERVDTFRKIANFDSSPTDESSEE